VRSERTNSGGCNVRSLAGVNRVTRRLGHGLLVAASGSSASRAYYWVLTGWIGTPPYSAINDLLGLAFGGSLILRLRASRRRHLHEAADVGADLVGKLEAGIRRPIRATRP